MLHGAKLDQGAEDVEPIKNYEQCLSMMLCQTPTENCYFGKCPDCPGTAEIEERLQLIFDANSVEEVKYKLWVSVDRADLVTIEQDIDEFTQFFGEKLKELAEHHFIATKQAEFMSKKKDRKHLKVGEVYVVGDFAMNYQAVVQDSIQGFHWRNIQTTLHPFVCYYKETEDSEVIHTSVTMVSDHLKHTTTTVYASQKKLVEFLKGKVPNLKKIIYSSDGAKTQYKNRYNVANLIYHRSDFGVEAEWHFTATAHGKGPSDGVSGCIRLSDSEAFTWDGGKCH